MVNAEPTNVKLREVRALQQGHCIVLGHIKTSGKGRTKAAILRDLRLWLDNIANVKNSDLNSRGPSLFDKIKRLVISGPKKIKLRTMRIVIKEHQILLGNIKTSGQGRTKDTILCDLKQWLQIIFDDAFDSSNHTEVPETSLFDKINKIVISGHKKVKLLEIQFVLKEHAAALGHIKTAGKGRNKKTIILDLEQWLQSKEYASNPLTAFAPTRGALYGFNCLVAGGEALRTFMTKEDHPFARRIAAEHGSKGSFTGWDNVEQRVDGFNRNMLINLNRYRFEFSPWKYSKDFNHQFENVTC